MRKAYQEELNLLADQLVGLARLAEQVMRDATTALLSGDLVLAENVITEVDRIHDLHHKLDEHALIVLARQQPVATDLRTIVAALRMSADLERMGHLALHVAEIVRLRHPTPAVPDQLYHTIHDMGRVALRLVARARAALAAKDPDAAPVLERDDDEMDRLQRTLYHELLGDSWHPSTETVMDVTLIGRYYERYADHAVSIARRVAFLAGRGLPDQAPTRGAY